jgi:hypothetical protein
VGVASDVAVVARDVAVIAAVVAVIAVVVADIAYVEDRHSCLSQGLLSPLK